MIRFETKDKSSLARIQNLSALTKGGLRKASVISAVQIKKRAITEILRKKDGRVYWVRDSFNRRKRHRASRPGDTHANLTGKLRRSLGFRVRPNEITFGYGVERNDAPEYAQHLEFAKNPRRRRPTLRNAIKLERATIANTFERELRREVQLRRLSP